MFSKEVEFTEDLGPRSTEYTWQMNLSVLFTPPGIQDWNSLLPYHSWDIPQGNWIEKTTQLWGEEDWGGSSWSFRVYEDGECQYVPFTNIGWVRNYDIDYQSIDIGNMLVLENEFGQPLAKDAFPNFPDYTFNGLFPNMSLIEWENLMDILE